MSCDVCVWYWLYAGLSRREVVERYLDYANSLLVTWHIRDKTYIVYIHIDYEE